MKKLSMTLPKILLFSGLSAGLIACQSASQSASSPSMPSMPSSSSQSSQSSPSMPSPSSQSSSSSSSMPSSSSSPSAASSSPSFPSPSQSSSSSSSQAQQSQNASRSQSSGGSSSALPTLSSSFPQTTGPNSANSQANSGSRDVTNPSGDSNASRQGTQQGQQGSNSAASSFPAGNAGQNSPGGDPRTQSQLPGDEQQGENRGGRDTSTGDLDSGISGVSGPAGDTLKNPGGDYTLDTLPNGVLSGNSGVNSQNTGPVTAAERAAVLDEALRRGYETFDGFILSERERAQNESNTAGSAQPGGEAGGGGGGAQGQPQILESGIPSGVVMTQPSASSASQPNQTFPPPEDIPSGRDDDVVARQLREAAMSEPDPELREALWDEYRNYTGISEGEEQ